MKCKPFFFLLMTMLFVNVLCQEQQYTTLPIKKVVIWGHKLHSGTHYYIHWGFHRAFKALGYEIFWFDEKDNIKNIDFSHSLFLTEGQVDNNMPIRKDCFYILHNCKPEKYTSVYKIGHAIT